MSHFGPCTENCDKWETNQGKILNLPYQRSVDYCAAPIVPPPVVEEVVNVTQEPEPVISEDDPKCGDPVKFGTQGIKDKPPKNVTLGFTSQPIIKEPSERGMTLTEYRSETEGRRCIKKESFVYCYKIPITEMPPAQVEEITKAADVNVTEPDNDTGATKPPKKCNTLPEPTPSPSPTPAPTPPPTVIPTPTPTPYDTIYSYVKPRNEASAVVEYPKKDGEPVKVIRNPPKDCIRKGNFVWCKKATVPAATFDAPSIGKTDMPSFYLPKNQVGKILYTASQQEAMLRANARQN